MINNNIQSGLEADARRVTERILMGKKYEDAANAAASLSVFIAKQGWSQAKVADKLGISTAVVNQFLQNKYAGNLDELTNKVTNLINSVERQQRQPRNPNFIQTTVAKLIGTVIVQTEGFSDNEGARIGVIIGDSGWGKSRCLEQYALANKNTIYVELDQAMTSTLIFAEIADKLGIGSNGSLGKITRNIIDRLKNRQTIIMLDEASFLDVKQLDQLRQIIAVKSRCPLVLAGNRGLFKTIMSITNFKGSESLDQFTGRLMCVLNLDMLAAGGNGGTYTEKEIRQLYEYGGLRLTNDAVKTLQNICNTSRTGRLHTCKVIITSLHVSGVVAKNKLIDSRFIRAAIKQLDLPMQARLPIAESDITDEKEQAIAKAG